MYRLAALLALTLAGCGASPGARPDDMSAEEHRAHSAMHAERAAEHQAKFEPGRRMVNGGLQAASTAEELVFDGWTEFNPTDWHAAEAETERHHAKAHLEAALALEKFEAEECAEVPPAERVSCPLMSHIEAVGKTKKGVAFRFTSETDMAAVERHARCHLAFGRAEGRNTMPNCPLYAKGARTRLGGDHILVVETSEAGEVDELRRRAHTHTPASPKAP